MARMTIETYVDGRSRLHLWTPQLKLIALAAMMFAFAMVTQLALIPLMLGLTALLYGLSGLPIGYLVRRLRYPGMFILAVVALLPLTSGETVVAQLGPLAIRQEGLAAMTLVVSRFLSILTVGFVLLGTTPFLTLLRSLRSFGLPTLLADMILLTYRYLFETAEMLGAMERSMRLRGFGYGQKFGHSWKESRQKIRRLVGLMGTLLIRSYERSERIYQAMRLRGYGQISSRQLATKMSVDWGSGMMTGGALLLSGALVGLEVWLRLG